jgi:hypothetical protein
MKKVLTALALLSVIAAPAFAQGTKPDQGAWYTGGVAEPTFHRGAGERAYDMAPVQSSNGYGESSTGGGSFGYNQAEQQAIMNR